MQSERKCPTGVAFTAAGGRAVPLRCGSWNCPTCARINARRWAIIARYGVDHLPPPTYFWTLTLPSAIRSRPRAFEKLPTLWDVFRKRIQRHTNAWLYIAFVEGQPQRGYMPHFHILSSVKSYIRLKDIAAEVGFGFQAKEIVINSEGAAQYVAKYASKQGQPAPKGFRRVRASRNWPKPPDNESEPYIVKAGKETVFGFLSRVAMRTHRDIGELYEDYTLALGNPIDPDEWSGAYGIVAEYD